MRQPADHSISLTEILCMRYLDGFTCFSMQTERDKIEMRLRNSRTGRSKMKWKMLRNKLYFGLASCLGWFPTFLLPDAAHDLTVSEHILCLNFQSVYIPTFWRTVVIYVLKLFPYVLTIITAWKIIDLFFGEIYVNLWSKADKKVEASRNYLSLLKKNIKILNFKAGLLPLL